MKINHSLELDENKLRQVRAAGGRGGRATRAEVRIWLNRIITAAIAELPPAKVRACNTSRMNRPTVSSAAADPQREAREAAAPCDNCGNFKSAHVGRLLACPLSKKVKPGSRFACAALGGAA